MVTGRGTVQRPSRTAPVRSLEDMGQGMPVTTALGLISTRATRLSLYSLFVSRT